MELRQLATFIRVAQFKSFSRAAESLGYSQSAVTVQIRQLEEELDTRLFDRMGKRIALTDTGERFLSHACDVMNQVNQARMSVTSTAELHGSLHIGTIESLACLKLPTVLHLYRKFNPKVSIRITVGEPEDLIEHMERGELDMIYVLDEPLYSNNWNKLMEQREEIVFVASASLREELGGKELTIEELLTQPFFLTEQDNYRRVLNRRLAARRTILTPSLECGDTSLLIRMLEIDRGVSFLPWYAVENSVKEGRLIRLSVEDCYISLYRQIFSHKEKWRTREMDEFVRVASWRTRKNKRINNIPLAEAQQVGTLFHDRLHYPAGCMPVAGAGGKREDMVVYGRYCAGTDHRQGNAFVNEGFFDCFIGKRTVIRGSVKRCLIGRIDAVRMGSACIGHIYLRMCLQEILLFVVLQRGKHRAVVHPVTVHDGVKAAEIGRAAAVHENRADCAAVLVPGVCQIIVVVRALHQRIGNLGARNGNPADDITVDLLQSRQVHLLQRLCIWVGRRSGFGFGLRFLLRRCIQLVRQRPRCTRRRQYCKQYGASTGRRCLRQPCTVVDHY